MALLRPSLDARHVTPSAVRSESLATHALKKRLTLDEMAKGIVFDSGKIIPVSLLLAWFQHFVPFPKPANSDPTPPQQPQQQPQQQVPPPGVPSPQNPTYYPGAPINQEPPGQTQVTPQSYYNPSSPQNPTGGYYPGAPINQGSPGQTQVPTNPQVSYQDPRYTAALQQQAQQLASAGGQTPQDSQPEQAFGSTVADLSQMTPKTN